EGQDSQRGGGDGGLRGRHCDRARGRRLGAGQRAGGDLPPPQPVRRRVRARPRRIRGADQRPRRGRKRHQRHADRARSALLLPEPAQLPRHAGADARRVRRPGHRGHAGRRLHQGDLADRRDARRPRRGEARRPHHPPQRQFRAGPVLAGGGGADARRARQHHPHHPPARGRGPADRAEPDARSHPPAGGALPPGGRRRRLCAPHLLQRADRGRAAPRRAIAPGPGRRIAERLGAGPPEQPRRPSGPSGAGGGRLPAPRRDRVHPRPAAGGRAALERQGGRHRGRPQHRGADQRRLRLGVRDRGRRAPGPPAGHRSGCEVLRQGQRADGHADPRPGRHPPDHGALLHAVRPVHPGHGHRAGHRGAGAARAGHGQHPARARGRPAPGAAERRQRATAGRRRHPAAATARRRGRAGDAVAGRGRSGLRPHQAGNRFPVAASDATAAEPGRGPGTGTPRRPL
ncbi:MAG: Carboxyl-terminal protease, partial [uncultured Acetobacteraceae bacterium]